MFEHVDPVVALLLVLHGGGGIALARLALRRLDWVCRSVVALAKHQGVELEEQPK